MENWYTKEKHRSVDPLRMLLLVQYDRRNIFNGEASMVSMHNRHEFKK